jgi:diguanylate cyclase (GGDEF)-like protein
VTIYIMIVATLNLVLGYWLGIFIHEDAQEASDTCSALPTSPIIAAPSALAPSRVNQSPITASAGLSIDTTDQPTSAAAVTVDHAGEGQPPLVSEIANELTSYRGQLADFDSRLRASAVAPDREQAESYLSEFKTTSEQYLAQQERAAASLNHLEGDDFVQRQLHADLQHALDAQRHQVEQANEHLEDIDFEANLAAGFQQLLAETAKVIESNYVLGDKLNRASQRPGVTVHEQDDEGVKTARLLVDRDRFEAALESWWHDQKDTGRSLTLVLVEIDRFAELNQKHGITVGDAVLQATSRFISRSLRTQDLATRYSGPKFLVMLPDTPVQDSTNMVERLRQTIASSEFVRDQQPIDVTISCAVAEAEHSDTLFTLLDRVELTLQESRRYGSNCTYIYEENHPSPVTPPSFDLSARTISI